MRKILAILLTIAMLPALCAHAQSASAKPASASVQIEKCAEKLRSAHSLTVMYTATADGRSTEGELVVQGDMFTITAPGMISWFDGKTQWTFSSQIGEVNIIDPTPEEIAQINPLAILSSFSRSYTAKQVTNATNAKTSTIRLTPKASGNDIRQADVAINRSTGYPSRIALTMANKQTVTIVINDIRVGKKLPASRFRFDKKLFPGVQVVDLR